MNLASARVVLRPRTVADILDIAAPFCLQGRALLGPLAALLLAPAFAACLWLRHGLAWPWWWVWLAAIGIAGLLHGPFCLAAADLLFHQPRRSRALGLLRTLGKRLPAFFAAHLLTRALLLLAAPLFVTVPWLGVRFLFVHEVVLLEGAGPFSTMGRSGRFSQRQGGPCFGLWLGIVSAPLAAALAAELVGQAIVAFTFQLGQPFGALFSDGGSPYALLGFFLSVPYTAAARFLKYIDIRTRKEGWDIQLRFLAIAATAGLIVLLGLGSGSAHAGKPAAPNLTPVPELQSLPGPGPEAVSAPGTPDIDQALRETLRDPRLRFCHDPEFPVANSEIAWCDRLPKDGPRAALCPAFRKACSRGPSAHEFELPEPPQLRVGAAIGSLAQLFMWALIGLALGLLVYYIVRNATRWRRDQTAPQPARRPPASANPQGGPDAAAETDVDRLLALARAAADAGRFDEALGHAYAALLRRLEGAHLIRVHRARTNGDYLRELARAAPALRGEVAKVVSTVERVQFGGATADAATFGDVLARVSAIRPAAASLATLTTQVALGLGLWLALLSTVACGLDDRGGWDLSPSGSSALIGFLKRTGLDVKERLAPLSRLDFTTAQVVLLPGATLDDEDWQALRDWIDGGGRLIVAGPVKEANPLLAVTFTPTPGQPGLQTTPLFDERFGDVHVEAPARARVASTAPVTDTYLLAGKHPYAVELFETPRQQSAPDRDDEEDGAPLAGEDEAPEEEAIDDRYGILVFADQRLFTNAALVVPENAEFLYKLLAETGGSIEFVGNLTGLVANNPVQSVGRGRLAPLLLQLFGFLLVLFSMKGALFGRARELMRDRRRRFSEHVLAVAQQYRRAGAYQHSLDLFATYVLERLRERVRPGGGERGVAALAERLAMKTGQPIGDMARLILEARETPEPIAMQVDRKAALAAARHRLRAAEALARTLVTMVHRMPRSPTAPRGRARPPLSAKNEEERRS